MNYLPQDDWFELRMMGTKVGYTHVNITSAEHEGLEIIQVRSEMRINLKRSGLGIELERTKVVHMDKKFQPLHFITHSNESGEEKRVEGQVQDGQIFIRTSLSGDVSEDRKPIPEDAIFEDSLGLIARERGLKVGNTYELNVFNLELFRSIPTRVTVTREDTVNYDGQTIPVIVVDYNLDIMGGIRSTEWVGKDGTTYKMEMSSLGIGMELVRTDREQALGEVGEVDVILEYRILPRGSSPVRGSYFKARVMLNEGDIRKAIMQTDDQSLILDANDARKGILEINRSPVSTGPNTLPIHDTEASEFLKSTVYVQADDPAIQQKSKEIIGEDTDAWEVAQKICRWVYANITDKNLKVGFGSAKQTLQSLEGDCTEHTVLFTALARAAGIPTRIVAGLVYQGEAFYYHFWPEVKVGRWVQMEPTLGQTQADATHIQLAGGHLESESVLEFGEGVLRTLNQLQIETIESH